MDGQTERRRHRQPPLYVPPPSNSTLRGAPGGVDCETVEIAVQKEVPPGAVPPKDKPLAVITARVHPGESNASWMMHGWLQFLCSSAPEAQSLREACDWLVVPMLNPDGVIHGSYRCGLAGMDLNRTFGNPHKKLHPTVRVRWPHSQRARACCSLNRSVRRSIGRRRLEKHALRHRCSWDDSTPAYGAARVP